MKVCSFWKHGELRLGIVTDMGIVDAAETATQTGVALPLTMEAAIAGGENALAALQSAADANPALIQGDIDYAPPVTRPEKIVCVGLNYINHAKESQMEIPKEPVLFSKFNNALTGHGAAVRLPKDSFQFDYEVELVIVMGKEAREVSQEDALSHVFGYTVGNDFSARDLQLKTGQWFLGKSCDDFAPVGPHIVTANQGLDVNSLAISSTVNGEVRQSSNTSNMIFDCATLISYISKFMTLKPGDLIFTGTPEGVILGYPRDKQVWLKPGDEMVMTVEGIGSLKNTVQ